MLEKTAEPRWFKRIEVGLLFMMTALFAYTLYELLSPNSTAFQPLRMVLLSGAMVVQAAASLVRERSRVMFYIMLASSMVLLVASLLA